MYAHNHAKLDVDGAAWHAESACTACNVTGRLTRVHVCSRGIIASLARGTGPPAGVRRRCSAPCNTNAQCITTARKRFDADTGLLTCVSLPVCCLLQHPMLHCKLEIADHSAGLLSSCCRSCCTGALDPPQRLRMPRRACRSMRQVNAGAGRRRARKKGEHDDDPSETYAPSHPSTLRQSERSAPQATSTQSTSPSEATGMRGQRVSSHSAGAQPGGTSHTSNDNVLFGQAARQEAQPGVQQLQQQQQQQQQQAQQAAPQATAQAQQQQWQANAQQNLAALPQGQQGEAQPLRQESEQFSLGSLDAALLDHPSWVRNEVTALAVIHCSLSIGVCNVMWSTRSWLHGRSSAVVPKSACCICRCICVSVWIVACRAAVAHARHVSAECLHKGSVAICKYTSVAPAHIGPCCRTKRRTISIWLRSMLS